MEMLFVEVNVFLLFKLDIFVFDCFTIAAAAAHWSHENCDGNLSRSKRKTEGLLYAKNVG